MYTKKFSEISKKDINLVGGKGASLGELIKIGVRVPPGFVITTDFDPGKLENEKNRILEVFDQLHLKYVAVRSSATVEDGVDNSFAGQFETFLGINRENLIVKIKECFDSVNSLRVQVYSKSRGIDLNRVKVAVVIQEMLDSEVSGVCFTANPITGDKNQIMIEAGFGLGEAIVSGVITPDNYLVNKKTLDILEKDISRQEKMITWDSFAGTREIVTKEGWEEKQKLPDEFIEDLSRIALKIEEHYQKPVDIEWALAGEALEGSAIYILQSRPITTL